MVPVVIPRPARVGASTESRPVALGRDGFAIACDDASRDTARLLRAAPEASAGWDVEVVPAWAAARPNSVTLTAGAGGLPADGYRLCSAAVPAEGGAGAGTGTAGTVTIAGGGPAGTFYGTQTLRLLLPPDTLRGAPPSSPPEVLEVPAADIEDAPRYAWRGVHLDVARHFLPKQWILRLIDLAALHKLNILHLHLTDDQGWRFPVRRYPLLTEVGGWRRRSPAGHARDKRFDRVPHGGYYTHADLREIVAYAGRRHMTVVPEIDMPGHGTF